MFDMSEKNKKWLILTLVFVAVFLHLIFFAWYFGDKNLYITHKVRFSDSYYEYASDLSRLNASRLEQRGEDNPFLFSLYDYSDDNIISAQYRFHDQIILSLFAGLLLPSLILIFVAYIWSGLEDKLFFLPNRDDDNEKNHSQD